MEKLHLSCIVCSARPVDMDHIKTRGSGGTDDSWNLLPSCRKHHQERHRIGIVSFATKYQQVRNYLVSNGWSLVNEFGQIKLRR